MENNNFLKNSQNIVLGVCISASLVISTSILSNAVIKVKKTNNEVISVTGTTEEKIISDYATWSVYFSRRGTKLTDVYALLKKDLDEITAFTSSRGVKKEEISIYPISTTTIYVKNDKGIETNKIEGYLLGQYVEIKTSDVKTVSEIAYKASELINKGIQLESYNPSYFYTRLGELKIKLLQKASLDAKERAKTIAESVNSKVGIMRSSSMGVFQITPVNSTEVSGSGINDSTSLEKKAMAVVHMEFETKT